MHNFSINKVEIREKFKGMVSPQAITDITGSVEYEINSALENEGLTSVKETLQKIVDYVQSEKNRSFIQNHLKATIITFALATGGAFLLPDYKNYFMAIFVLISLVSMPYVHGVAFEQALRNIRGKLTSHEAETYAITLTLLEKGWRPRTTIITQDSSLTQKGLALHILSSYLERIKSEENPAMLNRRAVLS